MNSSIPQCLLLIIFLCGSLFGYGQGKVTRQTQQSSKSKKIMMVSKPDGYINGHGWVDLGLPSGTKWGTCNVGASSPEKFGEYFAWGMTNIQNNYVDSGEFYDINKFINEDLSLKVRYDAASAIFGEQWCIPNLKQLQELKDQCKWDWCKIKNNFGYKITGPNGKTIFLPAGGHKVDNSAYGKNKWIYYWSSTPIIPGINASSRYADGCAYCLGRTRDYPSNDKRIWDWRWRRHMGMTIRPVVK